jgi:mevalonate kinase
VKLPARGRAGGKVILLGEHAVVYGRPALAAGLGLGLTVELVAASGPVRLEGDPESGVDPAADPRPLEVIRRAAAAVGLPADGFVARVHSEIPAGAGLGSSAALAIAALRAAAAAAGRTLGRADELRLGRELEAVFHGTPSGIDPAAAALGACFTFVRGEPPVVTPLRLATSVPLVIGLSGRARSTGTAVLGLRARWEAARARYEALFDRIGVVVEAGARALAAGDVTALGDAMDRNQALLVEAGVSAPEVERLVEAARAAGAVGAKLTGGGAGGAVIAIGRDLERIAAALNGAGARVLRAEIGGSVEEAA